MKICFRYMAQLWGQAPKERADLEPYHANRTQEHFRSTTVVDLKFEISIDVEIPRHILGFDRLIKRCGISIERLKVRLGEVPTGQPRRMRLE